MPGASARETHAPGKPTRSANEEARRVRANSLKGSRPYGANLCCSLRYARTRAVHPVLFEVDGFWYFGAK